MFDNLDCPDVWLLAGDHPDKQSVLRARLVEAGLRPTWQRMRIGLWAFTPPSKHFTPERLARAMSESEVTDGTPHRPIALATIYNTLNAFAEAGMLNVFALDTGERIFDTNTTEHYHIHLSDDDNTINTLYDVPAHLVDVDFKGNVPDGFEIADTSVMLRVRPKE